MATFELYRRSTIGMCLTETLDEMVQSGTLSPELAIQVLVQFDKSMTEALESQVKSKVTIKVRLFVGIDSRSKGSWIVAGHLHTYRFCDNVWTFILQDALFKNEDTQENVGFIQFAFEIEKTTVRRPNCNMRCILCTLNDANWQTALTRMKSAAVS
ncbi:Transcription initiation factor IIA subunit 2 [Morus notabilis]|uniref:Transcription initiation factor IIA subunit 2 n=1 Tax=Morus notabilis TaxID=981085 RepID=W9RX29_9ROSA|nr:Transcription initiation factor IIA subunit 2 [Morus notabilis]